MNFNYYPIQLKKTYYLDILFHPNNTYKNGVCFKFSVSLPSINEIVKFQSILDKDYYENKINRNNTINICFSYLSQKTPEKYLTFSNKDDLFNFIKKENLFSEIYEYLEIYDKKNFFEISKNIEDSLSFTELLKNAVSITKIYTFNQLDSEKYKIISNALEKCTEKLKI